jgi:hypothetical protein
VHDAIIKDVGVHVEMEEDGRVDLCEPGEARRASSDKGLDFVDAGLIFVLLVCSRQAWIIRRGGGGCSGIFVKRLVSLENLLDGELQHGLSAGCVDYFYLKGGVWQKACFLLVVVLDACVGLLHTDDVPPCEA